MVLHTFVHLSDLHIHDQPLELRPPIPRWKLERFPGMQGHDQLAQRKIARLLRELEFAKLASANRAHLLFTGDLTAHGDASQLAEGAKFLGHPATLDDIGLSVAAWPETAIPGNHDHWGHRLWFGPEAAQLKALFPFNVTVSKPITLPNGAFVTLIRVDADCDSSAPVNRYVRVFAKPRFGQALRSFTLGRRQENEIRVLLLHHSVSYEDESSLPRVGKRFCHVPSRDCEKALIQHLIDHQISVVLTGHVHVQRLRQLTVNGTSNGRVFEARCGTSAQQPWDTSAGRVWDAVKGATHTMRTAVHDWLYGDSPNPLPDPSELVHTALVHRLVERERGVWWQTTVYGRTEREGFRAASGASGGSWHEIQVLPWT